MADLTGDFGGLFRPLLWEHILLVGVVFVAARLLAFAVRWGLRRAAESAGAHLRLSILRLIPLFRLAIGIGAVVVAVPIVIEPSLRNVAALVAALSLALAFTLKDYGSSLVAGLVTVLEGTYQPGDWIEVDGSYGEVKAVDARAVRLVTADDTEIIIPHQVVWTHKVANATSGARGLLCVTSFYLEANHDAAAASKALSEVASSSSYRRGESQVTVVMQEEPWGTHYRLKAYVKESREQFAFITDLTIRGKDALRRMGVRFAQAPFAETRSPMS